MNLKIIALPVLVLSAAAFTQGAEAHGVRSFSQGGLASWYRPAHGARTANGERCNAGAFTAAHRVWPFGTRVRVTNRRNGRSVVVRINDRGPFVAGRVIDLSWASARAIGLGGVDLVSLARL